MPLSRRRKKKGKPVKRSEDRLSGLTLQDLINVVAYQEAHPEEAQSGQATIVDEIDFEDPDTQAVIRAVYNSNIDTELPEVCDEQGRSLAVQKIIEEHDKEQD